MLKNRFKMITFLVVDALIIGILLNASVANAGTDVLANNSFSSWSNGSATSWDIKHDNHKTIRIPIFGGILHLSTHHQEQFTDGSRVGVLFETNDAVWRYYQDITDVAVSEFSDSNSVQLDYFVARDPDNADSNFGILIHGVDSGVSKTLYLYVGNEYNNQFFYNVNEAHRLASMSTDSWISSTLDLYDVWTAEGLPSTAKITAISLLFQSESDSQYSGTTLSVLVDNVYLRKAGISTCDYLERLAGLC